MRRRDERMSQLKGTPLYVAPEVIEKDYSNSCDLWSLGVLVYIMLSGSISFLLFISSLSLLELEFVSLSKKKNLF